jgi:hypothetical protein
MGETTTLFGKLKDFLWAPVDIQSHRSSEQVEAALSKNMIKETTLHVMSYNSPLVGEVVKGRVTINYVDRSVFRRMNYLATFRGRIEEAGKGCFIKGRFTTSIFRNIMFLAVILALGCGSLYVFVQSVAKQAPEMLKGSLIFAGIDLVMIGAVFVLGILDRPYKEEILKLLQSVSE